MVQNAGPGTGFVLLGAMTRAAPFLCAFAWLVAAAALTGCQTHARYDRQVLAGETFTIHGPQTLLATPMVIEAQSQAHARGVQTDAWWTHRNDAWVNVRQDEPLGERVVYVIRTRNYVQTYGDRVHDVYRQITYATRYGQSVR